MPAETLAKIIEEGKRLEEIAKAAWRNSSVYAARNATRTLSNFRNEHFPRLLAVAEAALRCADDGCERVREEPDPYGIGRRILWCPQRWPADTDRWCWPCQMRAACAPGEGEEGETNG